MYLYIYIYIFIYIYIYIYSCLMNIRTYIIWMPVCVCTAFNVSKCMYMHVCNHVYMHAESAFWKDLAKGHCTFSHGKILWFTAFLWTCRALFRGNAQKGAFRRNIQKNSETMSAHTYLQGLFVHIIFTWGVHGVTTYVHTYATQCTE